MRYFPHRFQRKSLELLSIVKTVLDNLKGLLPLGVRQIFYQVISLADSPLKNSKRDCRRLGSLIGKARYCGQISFDDIEDRTRYASNLSVPLEDLLYYYYPEAWKQQPHYIEVFVEKEGLRSFFVRTLRPYFIPVTPIRGFDSHTDVMKAAKRIHKYHDRPRVIFVFSDFDPSGESISKDFEFRLRKCLVMLGEDPTIFDEKNKIIEIPYLDSKKVALTLEQVEKNNLPPKFAKPKDPRASSFIQKYGQETVVELDALPPKLLQEIILGTVIPYLDMDEVERIQSVENRIKTEGLEALESLIDLEETSNDIGEDR